jgi:hypothetical protein
MEKHISLGNLHALKLTMEKAYGEGGPIHLLFRHPCVVKKFFTNCSNNKQTSVNKALFSGIRSIYHDQR